MRFKKIYDSCAEAVQRFSNALVVVTDMQGVIHLLGQSIPRQNTKH